MASKNNLSAAESVGVGIVAVVLVVAAIAAALAISALLILAGWNIGVTAIVAACGGHVANISFLTSVGVSFAIGVIRRIFVRPAPTVNNNA